ncbi:hypothetical protein J6590_055041 [Homalodisca vitripennis]|nr:hypothetical protein J6590_055041 [Homalodisca vitripennis]
MVWVLDIEEESGEQFCCHLTDTARHLVAGLISEAAIICSVPCPTSSTSALSSE